MIGPNIDPQAGSGEQAEVEFYVAMGGEPGQEPTLIGRGSFEEVGQAFEAGRALDATVDHPAGEVVSPGTRETFSRLAEGLGEEAAAGLKRYEDTVRGARAAQVRLVRGEAGIVKAIRSASFVAFEDFTGFQAARTRPHSARTGREELAHVEDKLDEKSAENAHTLDRVTNAGRLRLEAMWAENITLLHAKLGDLAVGELLDQVLDRAQKVYSTANGGHQLPERPDKGVHKQFLVGYYVRLLRHYADNLHPDDSKSS